MNACTRLVLIHPGGCETVLPGGPVAETADCTLRTQVSEGVYTLTLTPRKEGLRLTALLCEVRLPMPLTDPENLLIYDNAAHTNDITGVFPYVGNETRHFAELAVLKDTGTGACALCGLLTAHRFWSSMRLCRREGAQTLSMTLRFELEGRPLNQGEDYVMERFLVAGGLNNENALLEAYADGVARLNQAVPRGALPTGWCSWSCYYGAVDEEKIRRAADGQVAYAGAGRPNLIQIDDGWQRCGSFCGEWVADPAKFPSGLEATARYVTERGMTFGLWLAPCMLDDQSEYYPALRDIAREEVTLGDHYHPFDLGDPRYLSHLRKTFRRMVDEYGARYFKLDFLAASVRYFNGRGTFVTFKDGFCIEVLRRALMTIRETVGEDVFLLSCGAQTLVGAGILNGARMSCDIIWGKSKSNPTYWQIMKDCLKTVSWRYFYHRRVYVNDPDGVVLRDIDIGDGFNCSYSEAELWAIAVAMSGGSVLSNDELEKLSPGRRRLYTRLLPPLDIPGRPVDYFQRPEPTAYILDYGADTKFLALYNLGDTMADIHFDLDRVGMQGALVVDCIKGKALGFRNCVTVENVDPHGGVMLLLRKPGDAPAFAFSDANIYGGLNVITCRMEEGVPMVERPAGYGDARVYVLWPEGSVPVGETVLCEGGYTLTRV